MSSATSDVGRLVRHIRDELGDDPEPWIAPDGYDSVALAVIDSVYSIGTRYSGVVNAVNRYRTARSEEGADANVDTASNLADAAERWGVQGLVERTNAWRTSTQSDAPRKAEVVAKAAPILATHGMETVADVRAQLTEPAAQDASPAKAQWVALPGQRSGLSWNYFLMLCGVPGVKADRMVVRFVTRAVGPVTPREARSLVLDAAADLGIDAIRLDHAIWRLESGRPVEYALA